MAYTPSDPSDCFELSVFGFGPFPDPNDPGLVVVCPSHPTGSGYGGAAFDPNATSGGTPYGLGTYGDILFGAMPVGISGGYGGDPYGLGSYGSLNDNVPPSVSGALSLNGYEIEVFFSEEMDPGNPGLTDPANYSLTPVVGAPATILSVTIEQLGSVSAPLGDFVAGVLSVVLLHTGTTLGGTYQVGATNITDVAGNPISPLLVNLLTKGDVPTYVVAPTSGNEVVLTFSTNLLPTSSEPSGTTGVQDVASYDFVSADAYPIDLTPVTATHPFEANYNQVHLAVQGMTSIDYTTNVVPSLAFDYAASVLPDADTSLIGVEVNPSGGGSLITSSKLSLNKTSGSNYGWAFGDLSGLLTDPSTFRADFDFNAANAIYAPPLASILAPILGTLTVEDSIPGSGVQVRVTLQRDALGEDQLHIQSGIWDVAVSAAWSSTGDHTITVIRNRKADLYAVLFDGTPLASTAIANATDTAATIGGPGVAWVLSSDAFAVTGFQLLGLNVTASNTVYSDAWNFLHEVYGSFTGSDALTRSTLLTRRGPLVKDWGDATPATPNDVEVRVNGVAVEIAAVNPYIGLIQLLVPIPLLPAGDPQANVAVDYKWFATPAMPLGGLNTWGAVLNKWDRSRGHHDPALGHGEQIQTLANPKGAAEIDVRFPMGVVLGPWGDTYSDQPVQIGHRYMGFEREYSALLNSPTLMLLNQNPNLLLRAKFGFTPTNVLVSFNGESSPIVADPVWTLLGTDAGQTNAGLGTITVVDDQSGSYADTPPVAMYSRTEDLTNPCSSYLVTRFQIDTDLVVADGVFTGVGFGLHDNRRLYLVGALLVNGVKHIGMLTDATNPGSVDSWQIGPAISSTILTSTTIQVATADLPTNLAVGDRFQILTGTQAGVFTITAMERGSTCTITILTVDTAFPARFDVYGNKYPTLTFELDWSGSFSTYRLVTDPDQITTSLYVSGARSGLIVDLTSDDAALFPEPANTPLLLTTGSTGEVFWGSLSLAATNSTVWTFFRYGIVPDQSRYTTLGTSIFAEMDVVPEDATPEWFRVQTFGYSEADGTDLFLKATSADDALDFTYAYKRLEPFFDRDTLIDLTAQMQVDTGVLGAGSGSIQILDGTKDIRLSTLIYREYPGSLEFRKLIRMPALSMAGLRSPVIDGWATTGTYAASVYESRLNITHTELEGGGFYGTLNTSGLLYTDTGSRVFEGRFAVTDFTSEATGEVGVLLAADIDTHFIGVMLRDVVGIVPAGVRLVTDGYAIIEEYDFDWTDGLEHTYRVIVDADAGTVVLVLDDAVQAPVAALVDFIGGAGIHAVFIGAVALAGNTTSTVAWASASIIGLPPLDAQRTIGVYRGGDVDHINSYEIPRTDSSTAPNSAETGPVVVDMDWTSAIEVRMYRDPEWGITVYRPDLALPPYYTPETPGVPGTGFITKTTEPSAGWINVEESQLPKLTTTFGSVGFGSLRPEDVTQQRWGYVRYRYFKALTDDFLAYTPQGMVLNRANVISSGEMTRDTTPEIAVVQSLDTTHVSLLPTHIYADRIFKIIDGNVIFTEESWTFRTTDQTITLVEDSEGNPRSFSGSSVPLTVVYAPGKPVTNTYLEAQPLLDSVNLLNEGTPPFIKSQLAETVQQTVLGSTLTRLKEVLSDPTGLLINDNYKVLDYLTEDGAFYEGVEFLQLEDSGVTGLLAPFCEGTLSNDTSSWSATEGNAIGGSVWEWSGSLFTEQLTIFSSDAQPSNPFLLAPYEGGAGGAGQYLYASGGSFYSPVYDGNGDPIAGSLQALGGNLSPGSAILWPNFPSGNHLRPGQGRIYQQIDWHFNLTAVLADTLDAGSEVELVEVLDAPTLFGDNVPPSLPEGWEPNPDGVSAGTTGAALFEITTPGDYSRYGPWGGISSLTPYKDSGYFDMPYAIVDGTTVTITEMDTLASVTFVARNVPVGPLEFALFPQPHVNLAAAINTDVTASGWVTASAGLNWFGDPSVAVEALAAIGPLNMLAISTSDPTSIRISGVLPIAANQGRLTGGVGLMQSSLVGGGTSTLNAANVHDPLLGILVAGGSALPSPTTSYFVVSGP